ncbi:hypothetical protein BDR06DRAFT_885301 [Suillus hirtellus]|nr:hypothetical protein BDR06DRAFT_885301 [Suillus hirtellus]
MNPQMGYPRPINRVPPPQFLTHFHAMEENWHMTEELMAEIERADYAQALSQQPPVPGMSGVAYAGGAASGAVYVREVPSPLKDPVGDRVRANERTSPKDADGQGSGGMQRSRSIRVVEREKEVQPSDSARARERPLPSSQTGSPSYSPLGHRVPSPERTSPPYHTPTGSSGGESVTAVDVDYVSYKRDSYQSNGSSSLRLPSPPPTVRKAIVADNARVTPPAVSKFASNTPPLQAMKTRTPDKSLPVQEEPEDDIATSKNGDDYAHGNDYNEDDDNDTLIENDNDFPVDGNRDHDGELESYTPRSPTASLPEPYSTRQYPTQPANQRLSSLTKHHRSGSTDRLGLRSFDAAVFEKPPIRSTEERRESPALPVRLTEQIDSVPEHNLRHEHSRTFSDTRGAEQQQQHQPQQSNGRLHPLQNQVYSDDQNHDDAAAAYISHYFQSPRPVAPIPPTPHSQTAAPSPLISSMQSMQASPAPPVGSPYPYPFSHVRRNNVYSTYPIHTAPSSNYDPNHPSVIEEQLALQMQMYALNNHAALSDSTFSPSSTPFPGAGYNPWTFLQASRAFGGGVRPRFDSTATMSIQSSPSHQPVSLPFPTGKIKRRQASADLRVQSTIRKRKIKPPPRVDSTQPRDTSPEPYSSGEETAGEERFEVAEEGNWVNGLVPDDGTEWVDEDEDDKDELLDLEYHPNYVNNIEKRRRRWDTRWEALQQAFEALDCETDTTMVLLAAPSHSTKLHALTSRSIRREIGTQSPSMLNIRNSFRGIAARRRASRAKGTTLVERLLNSTSSGDGSDCSSESREGDLKRALETALGSLGALRSIYDHRVARWEDEMGRINDERDRVEMLLRQTLGVGLQNGNGLPDA